MTKNTKFRQRTLLITMLGIVLTFCMAFTMKKGDKPVYVFGLAASFNDSIVYYTEIQILDSVSLDKEGFLPRRELYSYQLKNYFTSLGLEHRTCIISFALKRKDIEKKYKKMKNKYVKAGNYDIKSVSTNDFHFTAIKPDNYEIEAAQ